ncbi:hypothetical protein [Thalassospira profundimaris]|uniref:Uncharacterized protein n=1 Tax=Thalassospira profundimaris TaxID=502049 RepID=A0A367WP44_9PROT|nr:hypothetical protein [Thalassospira profundimaris]RCK43246.1 hypothetical protein TH30_19735 [Thalassospira profundimaris]
MDDAEYSAVVAAAEKVGLKPARFVKDAALMRARASTDPKKAQREVVPVLTVEQESVLRGLLVNIRGIRGLLNQIAKNANIVAKGGESEVPLVDACVSAVDNSNQVFDQVRNALASAGAQI